MADPFTGVMRKDGTVGVTADGSVPLFDADKLSCCCVNDDGPNPPNPPPQCEDQIACCPVDTFWPSEILLDVSGVSRFAWGASTFRMPWNGFSSSGISTSRGFDIGIVAKCTEEVFEQHLYQSCGAIRPELMIGESYTVSFQFAAWCWNSGEARFQMKVRFIEAYQTPTGAFSGLTGLFRTIDFEKITSLSDLCNGAVIEFNAGDRDSAAPDWIDGIKVNFTNPANAKHDCEPDPVLCGKIITDASRADMEGYTDSFVGTNFDTKTWYVESSPLASLPTRGSVLGAQGHMLSPLEKPPMQVPNFHWNPDGSFAYYGGFNSNFGGLAKVLTYDHLQAYRISVDIHPYFSLDLYETIWEDAGQNDITGYRHLYFLHDVGVGGGVYATSLFNTYHHAISRIPEFFPLHVNPYGATSVGDDFAIPFWLPDEIHTFVTTMTPANEFGFYDVTHTCTNSQASVSATYQNVFVGLSYGGFKQGCYLQGFVAGADEFNVYEKDSSGRLSGLGATTYELI